MKLIVGLGNPGTQYSKTRHNAGFLAVDRLVDRHSAGAVVKARFSGDCVEASIAATKCLLLKPMTFMNLSGQSVLQAMQFYKLPMEDLLVITDDLALPVGSVRLRASGGAGGHNGLSDIERRLGSGEYARCRIGIGPKPPMFDQAAFVLSRFTEEESDGLSSSIEAAADAVEECVASGIDAAMNRFNTKLKPPLATDGDIDPGWGAA
ncbi:Peptidyl-tRNA hydrolase [hydrothermal vent metagenome]|uniref:peptidyl-tRNA hydrolase n=1 Tax=hydrothermal vent metagenome TaxID=652676 RepID=A0A3B1E123_9ZZZZ